MKKKIRTILSLLFLAALVACGPAVLPQTETPSATTDNELFLTAEMGSTLAVMLTQTASQCDGCPGSNFSLSLTAQMATNFASTPSNTPPVWATVIPIAGDLGWGSVNGKIIDSSTFLPIAGATVRCEHSSYSSPYRCQGITTTNEDGLYVFAPIFLHDTDRIRLIVDAPGYEALHFEESFITQPDVHIDLGLSAIHTPIPSLTLTLSPTPSTVPSPSMMCTPPACSNGVLACGSADGCPGGCGTICQMPTP